jgi:transcriptional regulator with XRE-family HTH domain
MATREELFGTKLQELRQAREWSVNKAAQVIGISRFRLDELERGESRTTKNPTRPTREVVGKLASAYGVPTDYLLELAGYAREHPELADDEALLLDLFRHLGVAERQLAIRLIHAIPPAK